MSDGRVYIKPYGDSNYSGLDITTDIPVSLNYSIADVRNPESRNTDYSKTIVFPGTGNNNQVFGHIFEIDVDGTFNPTKKAEALIEVDTIEVFSGVLRLMKVNFLEDGRIEYECAIFARLANIFSVIEGVKLSDLDLSEYDHVYSRTNQSDSWATQIQKDGSNYVNFSGGVPTGEGYVYPLIDYGETLPPNDIWKTEQIYPSIYVKQYVDKIFSYAGYSYSSSFFNSELFKRLIIPYSGGALMNLSDSDVLLRQFRASVPTAYNESFPVNAKIHFSDDTTDPNTDPSNQYNTGSYVWTVAQPGIYDISTLVGVKIMATASGNATNGALTANLKIMVNGAPLQSQPVLFVVIAGAVLIGGTIANEQLHNITRRLRLAAGDTVSIEIEQLAKTYTFSGTEVLQVSADSYFKTTYVNEGIVEGDTIRMNGVIPKDILTKDFLVSLFRMFNLYIEGNNKTLTIEPRNTFFNDTVVDWTLKLDTGQDLEIIPMGDEVAKLYQYTYKSDTDTYNKRYSEKNKYKDKNKIYGDRFIEVDNDFATEEKKTEVIFSPTPLSDERSASVRPTITTISGKPLPTIIYTDNGATVRKAGNIRILYYGGLKSCAGWNHLSATGANTVYTSYPFAGHLDDAFAPTLDLSFGIPTEVYWKIVGSNYTDNNLYNQYYKQFIDEITNKDAKLVSGHFRLTPEDIYNLSFSAYYFIRGHWLRLNTITDYNPFSDDLTKVEFLKVIQGPAFTAVSGTVITGWDNSIGEQGAPVYIPPTGNNDFIDKVNLVGGYDNYVAPDSIGVLINGNNNQVHYGCENITISGYDNTVLGGCSNVVLINCNGLEINSSDVTYIDNILQNTFTNNLCDRAGQATLTAGTVTVSATGVTANSRIFLTPDTAGAINGILRVSAKGADSFTITSSNAGDTAVINYFIACY